jgi:hypothetical protein
MTRFDGDDIPPDLSNIERMLRDARPVPGDDTLDRMRPRTQPARTTSGRAPRRTFAVSLATVLAMTALTGGAAAAMFGNVPLLSKSSKSAPALMSAKRAASPASSSKVAATALGTFALPTAAGKITVAPKTVGGTVGTKALTPGGGGVTAAAFPFPNAGNFQYVFRQLICRLLRRLGGFGNALANAIGCPP